MLKKRRIILLCIMLLAMIAYIFWFLSGRLPSNYSSVYTEPLGISIYGMNRQHGNILAVQPWMAPINYAREDHFYQTLNRCLATAKQHGIINKKTIVVFPEYIGTWLVLCNERRQVYAAPTITDAIKTLILSHPFRFGTTLLFSENQAKDRVKYSLFVMKSKQMARIYDSTFAKLAKQYGVTIVAGSIILPTPYIDNGHLYTGTGALHNITAVYQPDGRAATLLTKKLFLTADEQNFAAGSITEGPQVYPTPAGQLGVMVCADSWFPKAYKSLKKNKAQIVIAPSFFSPDGFSRPWPGYNGAPNPADVDPRDLGRISEQEAWQKYALPGRIRSSGARFGLIAYFRGKIWDIASNGYVLVIDDSRITKVKNEAKSAVVNVWLP